MCEKCKKDSCQQEYNNHLRIQQFFTFFGPAFVSSLVCVHIILLHSRKSTYKATIEFFVVLKVVNSNKENFYNVYWK